jgi:hypothetical protein
VSGLRLPIDASPGEVLDRITILERKVTRVAPERRAGVQRELDGLRAAWDGAGLPDRAAFPLAAELARVNAILWDVEDRLRAREAAGDFGPAFVEDARSVYRTNDDRAALKRAVDGLLGAAFTDEKVHPDYARRTYS